MNFARDTLCTSALTGPCALGLRQLSAGGLLFLLQGPAQCHRCEAFLLPTPSPLLSSPFERVTGRKARGLQTEEAGCKRQTFFYRSLKRQEDPWEFSGEYWSGLPVPPPGDLPDSGIEPASPALAVGFSMD